MSSLIPYKFLTEDAFKSIMSAQAEAGSESTPEAQHFLLGIAQSKGNRITALLKELNLNPGLLRAELVKMFSCSSMESCEPRTWNLRQCYNGLVGSPYAVHLLELSASEALNLKQSYIGSEHLLLALTQDQQGSQLLEKLGINRDQWRRTISWGEEKS